MGKKNGKKLQSFFGQWSYNHCGMDKRLLRLRKSVDEVNELLKKCCHKKCK